MSVPIKKEPDPRPPFERCCFCRIATTYWTDLPDRTPAQQVACCSGCACSHKSAEVPTKEAWCAKERQLWDALAIGNGMPLRRR